MLIHFTRDCEGIMQLLDFNCVASVSHERPCICTQGLILQLLIAVQHLLWLHRSQLWQVTDTLATNAYDYDLPRCRRLFIFSFQHDCLRLQASISLLVAPALGVNSSPAWATAGDEFPPLGIHVHRLHVSFVDYPWSEDEVNRVLTCLWLVPRRERRSESYFQ